MPKFTIRLQVITKCFMAEHILRISQHRKVQGLSLADNWKNIMLAVKRNIYLCSSEQLTSQHPLNSYRLMKDTSDVLCMFFVLLISFLISKLLQTFQNAWCECEKQRPLHTPYRKATSSSPSQECYNHWQLAPWFTHKPNQMCLWAFEETHSRHWLILHSNCSPDGAIPNSQNEQVYNQQRCCTQPRAEAQTGGTHPTLSFHAHLYSSSLT